MGHPRVVDYSNIPEEWCVAEFVSTLPRAGVRAREYLKERGYIIPLYKGDIPQKSPLMYESVSFQFDYARR